MRVDKLVIELESLLELKNRWVPQALLEEFHTSLVVIQRRFLLGMHGKREPKHQPSEQHGCS